MQHMKSAELTVDQANAHTSIIDLVYSELSPRVANHLRRRGIQTVADLIALRFSLDHLQLGKMARREVDEFIRNYTALIRSAG